MQTFSEVMVWAHTVWFNQNSSSSVSQPEACGGLVIGIRGVTQPLQPELELELELELEYALKEYDEDELVFLSSSGDEAGEMTRVRFLTCVTRDESLVAWERLDGVGVRLVVTCPWAPVLGSEVSGRRNSLVLWVSVRPSGKLVIFVTVRTIRMAVIGCHSLGSILRWWGRSGSVWLAAWENGGGSRLICGGLPSSGVDVVEGRDEEALGRVSVCGAGGCRWRFLGGLSWLGRC